MARDVLLPVRAPMHTIVAADETAERGGVLATFSEQKRVGDWFVPRLFRVACVMGSAVIDLREAHIADDLTTLHVFTMFGSVEILVPPGVRVEVEGDPVVGEFSFDPGPPGAMPSTGPTIRVVGSAFLASVEVHVRYPGESAREAKRRAKRLKSGR